MARDVSLDEPPGAVDDAAGWAGGKAGAEAFLTRDTAVERLLRTARQLAATECCALIAGEEGTGRRAMARFLHQNSPRAAQPFHLVRCSAHDAATLEAMLFGAADGTVLLEEVEALPAPLQARLAVLADPGGEPCRRLPVRLLASSARDLGELVRQERLRQDLHLLLGTVVLTLPPLAARKDDIGPLACHFLAKARGETGKAIASIDGAAMALLHDYDWPGNVRELETVVRGAVAVCEGDAIGPAHLPPGLRGDERQRRAARMQTLVERERDYVLWVLGEVGGNQSAAARILGIDRVSLWRKLKRYGAVAGEAEA